MTRLKDLKAKMLKNPVMLAEYETLRPEHEIALAVARARRKAGMTQAQLAEAIGTKQQAISRLESGKLDPKISTLRGIAKATGAKMHLDLG